MHSKSYEQMDAFRNRCCNGQTGSVLDIGSYDVNGTYRPIFPGWDYLGVDIRDGPNVDRILTPGDDWNLHRQFDAVICGQTLNHALEPWEVCRCIGRHIKPGGHVCLIAPMKLDINRHPLDCWRIGPDGMRHLLVKYCDVEVIEVSNIECGPHHVDTVGIGRKLD